MMKRLQFWWRWWGRMLTLDYRFEDFEDVSIAKFRELELRIAELEGKYRQ